jgi:hypothetical protein
MDDDAATRRVTWITLLTSTGTLICCALPALLVAIGAGAALAFAASAVPQLVWISEHKELVFGLASAMLIAAGAMQWRARTLPCPTDPALARACTQARAFSRNVYLFAVIVFLVGAFFAFVAPLLNA